MFRIYLTTVLPKIFCNSNYVIPKRPSKAETAGHIRGKHNQNNSVVLQCHSLPKIEKQGVKA
jgi:hypothetical protein